MTNAEKYLKEGVDLEEFSKSIMTWYFGNYAKANDFARIKSWAEHKIETLTEDERVILKNIGEDCISLMRVDGAIYFHTEGKGIFPKLFQFIKDGEEYSIEELLKGE